MNQRSDIERALTVWMADGPTAIPDRVVDVVAVRIGVQRQRRGRSFSRRTPVTPIRLIAALAAAVVVAFVGYNLLPRQPSIVGPSTAPSPATTAAPEPTSTTAPSPPAAGVLCEDGTTSCGGRLTAGSNASVSFRPTLTFTVPDGWNNSWDTNRAYVLRYNFARGHFFSVYSQLAIPEQDATCSPVRRAGAGNTVADWVEFLTGHPGLDSTAPVPVSVGGYDGVQLDVSVAADWTATCPNSLEPAVLLMTDSGAIPERRKWIDDQQTTFRILDVAGETVIVYLESSPDPADLAALNVQFQPVIDSFVFTPDT